MAYSDRSRDHANNGMQLFPFVSSNGKNILKSQNEILFPSYVNNFENIRRLVPQTSVSTNVAIFNGQEVDFQLVTPNGHLKDLYAEITMIELGGVSPATFNAYNIFNRLEVELSGVLFRVIYPDEFFYIPKLFQNQLEFNRVRTVEGLQPNYAPATPTLLQKGSFTFYLKIPLFVGSMPDLRWLASPPLLRFYFNAPGSFASGSALIGLTQFNLVIDQINTPLVNLSIDKTFRYINWNRYLQTVAMVPNSEYVLQLNTLSGYSAMLFFMIRDSPTSTNPGNWETPRNILNTFELHDSSNNIIAISQNNAMNLHIWNKSLPGDIIDSAQNPYFYTIIFSTMPDKIEHGICTGGMQMTSRENLYLYTNSTMAAGNYEITVWSADMCTYTIRKDGSATFTR